MSRRDLFPRSTLRAARWRSMRVTRSIGAVRPPRGVPVVFLHGGPAPARRRRIAASRSGELPHHHLRPARRRRSAPLGEPPTTARRISCAMSRCCVRYFAIERGVVVRRLGARRCVELCDRLSGTLRASSCAIFLCRQSEMTGSLYGIRQVFARGVARRSPRRFGKASAAICHAYYRRVTDPNRRPTCRGAQLEAFMKGACSTLLRARTPSQVRRGCMGSAGAHRGQLLPPEIVAPEDDLIARSTAFARFPTTIVQGRYDMVCPIGTRTSWRVLAGGRLRRRAGCRAFGDGAGNPAQLVAASEQREAAELSRKRLPLCRFARTGVSVRCWRPRRVAGGFIDKNARDDAAGSTMADRGAGGWAILGGAAKRAIDTVRDGDAEGGSSAGNGDRPAPKAAAASSDDPHSSRSASAFSTSCTATPPASFAANIASPRSYGSSNHFSAWKHHETGVLRLRRFSRRHLPRQPMGANAECRVRYYDNGNGKDLGATCEFRTGAEFAYRFDDRSRLGFTFHHISNAGIARRIPGGGDGDRLLAALRSAEIAARRRESAPHGAALDEGAQR